jgi:hypothetical protein
MLKQMIGRCWGGRPAGGLGRALALEIDGILTALSLERKGGDVEAPDAFYVTDSIPRFQRVAGIFLGRELANIRQVDLQFLPRQEA